VRGKERLIFPRVDEVRWWAEIFGRSDEEMNFGIAGEKAREGRPLKAYANRQEGVSGDGAATADGGSGANAMEGSSSSFLTDSNFPSRARTPILVGVETSEESVGPAARAKDDGVEPTESTAELAEALGGGSAKPNLDRGAEVSGAGGKTELADELKGLNIKSEEDSSQLLQPSASSDSEGGQATNKEEVDSHPVASTAMPTSAPPHPSVSTNDHLPEEAYTDTDPLGVGSLTNGTNPSTTVAEKKIRGPIRRELQKEIQ
jgi:hypothetical protein